MSVAQTRMTARARHPSLIVGLVLATCLAIVACFGGSLAPHDPFYVDMENRLQSASVTHWLGTDHLGRDVFSRIVYGAQLTVGLSVLAILMSVGIGVPIGLVSGYLGGKLDAFFMRIIDGILAFPDFILAVAIAGILGPSLTNIIMAIVLVRWIMYARVVRGLVLAEKEQAYVLVSRLACSHPLKTIRLHIWPHVLPDIIVMVAIDVGKVILLISSLSYIGLGAQPPMPEWGAMLNDGQGFFQVNPALMIYPGLAIIMTVLCCQLLGDGLKSYFDIRKRRGEG
ncbi:nickel transporter permease [Caldalkalibacillus salinus]|uniref:nickel transporter permease n=1 Tax=Caldalkalibacillus salinus TaxID=2803787 RepID=UPI0019238A54|nr:nickel transporter permease [Caldalkalibacillus salinus]